MGVADWRDEFVRDGVAATRKFIPELSNAEKCTSGMFPKKLGVQLFLHKHLTSSFILAIKMRDALFE
jgi:hypothetical protein